MTRSPDPSNAGTGLYHVRLSREIVDTIGAMPGPPRISPTMRLALEMYFNGKGKVRAIRVPGSISPTVRMQLRIGDETIRALDKIAAKYMIPRSDVIRRIVRYQLGLGTDAISSAEAPAKCRGTGRAKR